jgi:hypothetical protein
MLFCISAKAPSDAVISADGRWTVEAVDGQRALEKIVSLISPTLWPHGSEWYVSLRCGDCPYRTGGPYWQQPTQSLHCHGRRGTRVKAGTIPSMTD